MPKKNQYPLFVDLSPEEQLPQVVEIQLLMEQVDAGYIPTRDETRTIIAFTRWVVDDLERERYAYDDMREHYFDLDRQRLGYQTAFLEERDRNNKLQGLLSDKPEWKSTAYALAFLLAFSLVILGIVVGIGAQGVIYAKPF